MNEPKGVAAMSGRRGGMKAAVLHAFGEPIAVETVPDPSCPPDGVVVEVGACGVCRSDLDTWKGADPAVALPHVMGHELAGVVVESGPDCRAFAVGERVTAPFILGCGRCGECAADRSTVCAGQRLVGFTRWGAFAERVALPAADFNLVRLPERIGLVEAASIGCRVTTAWRALTDRAQVAAGEWVAVHGCGGVGLAAVLLAGALEARVVAVDVAPAALDRARALGVHATVDAAATADVGAAVRAITGGGAAVSLDAAGLSESFANSLRSLAPLGRHVQIGVPVGRHAVVPLPLLELVHTRQLAIFGTRGLGAAGFAPLFELIAAGALDLAALVTTRLPLAGVESALARLEAGASAGITVVEPS